MVHGSAPQSRGWNREVAEHFASNGIAMLLYDKQGVGLQIVQPDGSAPWSAEHLGPGYLDAMSEWVNRVTTSTR